MAKTNSKKEKVKMQLQVQQEAFKLSPSSLSLMGKCPRCFWLDKNGVWKRPQGIMPGLPNGMDRVLKDYFDSFLDKQIPQELKGTGCKLFADKRILEIWRNWRKGIAWKDKQGNVLSGAVDTVLTHNGKLVVLDFKTKGSAPKDIQKDVLDYYQNQMDIYNFLLRKSGYETEDYAYLMIYYPEKVVGLGKIIFKVLPVKVQTNPQNAYRIFKQAIDLLKGECPSEKCDWCELVK